MKNTGSFLIIVVLACAVIMTPDSGYAQDANFYDNVLTTASGVPVYYDTDTGKFGSGGSSSRRYKKNIEDLDLGLETVMNLRPVSFDYKEDYFADAPRQIGLIAEEVAGESPLLAFVIEDQPENVKYDRLTAVLIKAIQEQQNYIKMLEQRIEQLEEKIQ